MSTEFGLPGGAAGGEGRLAEYVAPLPSFTVEELLGAVPPNQFSHEETFHDLRDVYARYAREEMFPFKVPDLQGDDLIVVCPPLGGEELQYMFHYAAPSKQFGPDFNDTQNDWRGLYDLDFHKERLEAHRQIPNWKYVEANRLTIVNYIRDSREGLPDVGYVMRPVMHFTKDGETGQYGWNMDRVPVELSRALQRAVEPAERVVRMPVLGPLVVGAYSPDMRAEWGERLNYQLTNSNEEGRPRTMGATQSLAVNVGLADTLLTTPFVTNLLRRYELS